MGWTTGLQRPLVLLIAASSDSLGAGLPGRRRRDFADALGGKLPLLVAPFLFLLFALGFLVFLVKLLLLFLPTLALLVFLVTVGDGAVLARSFVLGGGGRL
jgi:hypothetical protein